MTVTSASDYANEGIETDNTFSSSINSPSYSGIYIPSNGYYFPFASVPDTQVFPVVKGTVTVNLLTSDTTAQSATISVTYYY